MLVLLTFVADFVNDVIPVRAKRSTYEHNLPRTLLKCQSQPAVIQQLTFGESDQQDSAKSRSIADLVCVLLLPLNQLFHYRITVCHIVKSLLLNELNLLIIFK